jgi:hypothetical protein
MLALGPAPVVGTMKGRSSLSRSSASSPCVTPGSMVVTPVRRSGGSTIRFIRERCTSRQPSMTGLEVP